MSARPAWAVPDVELLVIESLAGAGAPVRRAVPAGWPGGTLVVVSSDGGPVDASSGTAAAYIRLRVFAPDVDTAHDLAGVVLARLQTATSSTGPLRAWLTRMLPVSVGNDERPELMVTGEATVRLAPL